MGFVYEATDPGLAGLEIASLQGRAEAASPDLAEAGFCRSLDASEPGPAPTAMERVVVLGIGGSALGARSVHEACIAGARRPLVVVDNIDPDAFEAAWAGGDPRRTAWVVVSKSGGTTEPLTQFRTLQERLRGGGEIHVVTGSAGPLRDQARDLGLPIHEIPEEIGGRFSVFSPAGTVPLALAGHDVAALLEGARAARDHCLVAGNVASRLAALMIAASAVGRNVATVWCYGERLEPIGEWFRQLWGESLGKQGQGQSPLHCVGSTDQHSLQQLMIGGPPDKVVLVLAGPRRESEMDTILHAMRRATTAAMVRAGHPAATMRLDAWDERSVGTLLMALLCATVLAGRLMGVDPYGQPGVEAAKRSTRELLSDPGGEADRAIALLLGEGQGQQVP